MRGPKDTGRGSRTARMLALGVGLGVLAAWPAAVQAQDVASLYLRQRLVARTAEIADSLGPEVPGRPFRPTIGEDPTTRAYLAHHAAIAARLDSLRRADARKADSLTEVARLAHPLWRKVEYDRQGAFLEQYRETYWLASPPAAPLAIDTMATPHVRGLLQAAYGRPTRNADALREVGYAGSEFVQFEYWFVVNDSIPILVLDLDGPYGRGVLLAGAEAHAAYLPRLKADLAARLLRQPGPDPFVDYYHPYGNEAWIRTGYNGSEFYVREVRRPPRWSDRPRVDRWTIHR